MRLLAGILISSLFIQAPVPPPQSGTASVAGRAVNSGTNVPLSDVTVDLVRVLPPQPTTGNAGVLPPPRGPAAPRFSATTGDDGSFVINNVPAGQYRLYGTHDNAYVPAEYGQRSPTGTGSALNLADGEKLTGLTLNLTPTASVSGRITDPFGEPSVFTSILAFRIVYKPGGARKVEIAQSVLTDDHGDYRLYWLAPGQYYISALPIETRSYGLPLSFASRFGGSSYLATPMLGYRTSDTGEVYEETWLPIYFPGTTDIQAAKPMTLHAGEHINASLSVASSPTRTYQIRGVVIDDAGGPMASANLTLVPRKPEGHSVVLPAANSDAMGAYTIHGVLPGSYYLFATGGDSSPGISSQVRIVTNSQPSRVALAATLTLDVGKSNIDGLRIQMAPAANLSGRVVFDGASTSSGTPPRLSVVLVRDPELQGAPSPVTAIVGSNNAFTLNGIGIGDYRINIPQLPQNNYLKSIRLGAVDVLKDGLHFTGTSSESLDIVIGQNAGVLNGTLLDEKRNPFSNATIALLPEFGQRSQRLDLYKTTSSGSDGKFHFDGITPGNYTVFAWEDVQSGNWYDPDFIKNFEFRGTPVQIDEGASSKNLDIQVIPTDRSTP